MQTAKFAVEFSPHFFFFFVSVILSGLVRISENEDMSPYGTMYTIFPWPV